MFIKFVTGSSRLLSKRRIINTAHTGITLHLSRHKARYEAGKCFVDARHHLTNILAGAIVDVRDEGAAAAEALFSIAEQIPQQLRHHLAQVVPWRSS